MQAAAVHARKVRGEEGRAGESYLWDNLFHDEGEGIEESADHDRPRRERGGDLNDS